MSDKSIRAKILTKNRYLEKKLSIELTENGEFSIVDDAEELLFVDIDTEKAMPGAITMSYKKPADIALPFRIGEVRAMLSEKESSPILLIENERCVLLFGEKIKLTEIEYALFSLLYKKRSFVSRAEILETVWRGEADGGIINVYVHYLREKLEKSGEKIILSSRKLGYGISEKFMGGKTNA
jgi:DNA-binding winged helix-turn-helix (wHTH) protein